MFRNYLKIAVRSLMKQFSYTLINVIGLSTGVAAFLMIMLYLQFHLDFDKQIPNRERLFRVVQIQQADGIGEQHVAVNMGPLSEALKAGLPEVEDAVRIMNWGPMPIRVGEDYYNQDKVVWTDQSIFRLFGIQLAEGDTNNLLTEPRVVVLSEQLAIKYFGSVSAAIGKTIEFNHEEGYLVKAVMKNQPEETHMPMEMLVSYPSAEQRFPWLKDWGSNTLSVYIQLDHPGSVPVVEKKIAEQAKLFFDEDDVDRAPRMYLQPVGEIHLRSGHIKFQVNSRQGDYRIVLAFMVIAILVILIACINFINLAIARSVKRAKEVGVRKALGANRQNLIYQFLGESMIITLLSILASLILVEVSLPTFNQLLDTSLKIQFLTNPIFNIGLLGIWIVVSLLSGIYPAFYMSKMQAVDVLKGVRAKNTSTSGYLSKSLVVFQFSVAIVLIIVVIITTRQIRYVMHKDLGYNPEKVVGVLLQGGDNEKNALLLKQELRNQVGVQKVAAASFVNGVAGNQSTISVADSASTRLMARFGYVDEDFFPLMEIPFVEGRNFSAEITSDANESVIINQAAANALGWKEAVGKQFNPFNTDTIHKKTVIGVISDYHYYSIHERIEPAVYIMYPEGYGVVCVKYDQNDQAAFVKRLEESWESVFPHRPFEWVSVGERVEKQYRNDRNSATLFTVFTALSLLISALGLYGLTALRVEQRTKEIGIRKVLGGSIWQLMVMITREFLLLVALAGIFAIPLGYYMAQQILNQFAYTVSIAWYDGVFAILSALFIALLTIAYHAQHAANANPVVSLKYE